MEIDDTSNSDRRRVDRRSDWIGLGDYPVPELRKGLLTAALLLLILALLLYMVRDVLVGLIAGVVLGIYMIPLQDWLRRSLGSRKVTAILAIAAVTIPLVVVLVYSWLEISAAAEYLEANRLEVAERIDEAVRRLPFMAEAEVRTDLSRWVGSLANFTSSVADDLRDTIGVLVISVAVFLFTVFYILTDHERIGDYLQSKIPGRYQPLTGQMMEHVQAVVYGALYATFLTQLLKSAAVLGLNLLFDVPLALVLAIVSFFIGFFPIVGSWSVYLPVAIYVMVFKENPLGGLVILAVGFFGITLFMSMYLRPKIAAERSQVLNIYWMFIALVTGVYTFGLIGIIIGPVLIAILKAVFDTVTGESVALFLDPGEPVTRGGELVVGSSRGGTGEREGV